VSDEAVDEACHYLIYGSQPWLEPRIISARKADTPPANQSPWRPVAFDAPCHRDKAAMNHAGTPA
jgi:hypothetical protein